VVTIWEGIRAHFRANGCPLDFALYSNYERQVEALPAGHVDVAWNTPLAHVRAQAPEGGPSRSACASDRDFRSKVVVRTDAGIHARRPRRQDPRPWAAATPPRRASCPSTSSRRAGVDLAKVKVLPFDTDLGNTATRARASSTCPAALRDGRSRGRHGGDLVWVNEQAGRVDATRLAVLWTTPPFDHCMFDALPTLPAPDADAFRKALFAMVWDDPVHRRLLEMEGLRRWMPPREEGYVSLVAALDRQGGW
jgi:ABC-type phosphate/phosphonate transport system substrate-binding protein